MSKFTWRKDLTGQENIILAYLIRKNEMYAFRANKIISEDVIHSLELKGLIVKTEKDERFYELSK